MKSKLIIFIIPLLVVSVVAPSAFATEPTITKEQASKISESCSTTRQSLKNLQRADSRARTYFGAIYETVSSKYLKPMNLRLVNNDISSPDLIDLQTSLAAARLDFSDDFIAYSKTLEELISIDCRLEPENFYKKLIITREKRAKVAADVKTINGFLTSIVKHAEKLKESLK